MNSIGLKLHERRLVSCVHLVWLPGSDRGQQLLNRVEERLAWLRHELSRLAPKFHRLHAFKLSGEFFEQLGLLDQFGDLGVDTWKVAELPRSLDNRDHLWAGLVGVCLRNEALSGEVRVVTDVTVRLGCL